MNLRPHRRPVGRLIAVLALFLVVFSGRAAFAHGDEGDMTVTVAEAVAGAISVEVGILYANDDDLAETATVEATATGPAGQVVGPVPLPRVDGARYAGVIEVDGPGEWTVAIAAIEPTAAATAVVAVPKPAAPTTAPAPEPSATEPATTVAPPITDATPTTEPVLIAPAPPVPGDSVQPEAGPDTDTDTDTDEASGSNAVLVAGGVVVLLAAAAGAVYLRTRRSGR